MPGIGDGKGRAEPEAEEVPLRKMGSPCATGKRTQHLSPRRSAEEEERLVPGRGILAYR